MFKPLKTMKLLGAKLRGILRNSPKPFHPPSPRLRRVLLTFILAASCEVFRETTKTLAKENKWVDMM